MKKKMIALCLLVLLGCSIPSKTKTITWYVEKSMFVNEDNIKLEYDVPIHNKYIDAYNQVLKDKGYDFQIEVKYFQTDQINSLMEQNNFMNNFAEKHPEADVVDFYSVACSSYEPLTSYFKSDVGLKLKEEIPVNIQQMDTIDGIEYSIRKSSFAYGVKSYNFPTYYYESHKELIDSLQNEPVKMLEALIDLHEWSDTLLLARKPDLYFFESLIDEEYEPIKVSGKSLGIFIRREDHKVVSVFDDDNLLRIVKMLSKAGEDNAYGRTINPEKIQQMRKEQFLFNITMGDYPEELMVKDRNQEITKIVFGRDFLMDAGKLGILKSSDAKEESFESIALMNIDKDAANAMLYGTNIEYKDGLVLDKNSEPYANWNSFANSLIADQTLVEPANKKELAFEYVQKIDMDTYINPNFLIEGQIENIDSIISTSSELSALLSNANGYDEVKIDEELHRIEQLYEQGHLEDVKEILQMQLDQR